VVTDNSNNEISRKLASIQEIKAIKAIPNANQIEVATILGWKVVINKKDDFKIGSKCVYCEIDSILPPRPEFEFLKDRGYRIKTIKLRKQVSQGIAFPMSIIDQSEGDKALQIGDDVTKVLGILKWEPQMPAMLSGRRTKTRPGFIPKTDEDRIQTIPGIIRRHCDKQFYITEKLDGSSASYWIRDDEFGVASRNMQILPDIEKKGFPAWFKSLFIKPKPKKQNTFWVVALRDSIEEKLRSVNQDICIQGELCGPGIQKNKYRLKEHKVFVYNVLDLQTSKYLDFEDMLKFCQRYGFEHVPILENSTTLPNSVEEMVEISKGMSKIYPDHIREGIVIRSVNESLRDDHIGRLSFKVVNPNWLLRHDE